MSENIAQTVQKAIQDLVAPDVRELKVLVTNLQKQIDQRFDAQGKDIDQRFAAQSKELDQRFDAQGRDIDQRFAAQSKELDQRFAAQGKEIDQRFAAQSKNSDAQFKALMAALGEFKAQSELASVRVIAALSERVAVLEARHQ